MDMPQVGDVWEGNGGRRRVDRVSKHGVEYSILIDGAYYPAWKSTWETWVSTATLVERDGKAVV